MKNQIITIPLEELFVRSEAYFFKMCGFDRDLEGNRERIEEAVSIRNRYKNQFRFHCILSSYPSSVVCGNEIHVEDQQISCKVLNRIPEENILNVYFYGICFEDIAKGSPDKKDSFDLLDEFYLDTWMIAMLDGARDWIREFLKRREQNMPVQESMEFCAKEQKVFLTEAFGPGFYGIGLEEVPAFLKLVDGEQIGLNWKRGTMVPAKSNVGMYLALSKEKSLPSRDCASCLSSGQTCEFCKNYTPNRKNEK